MERPERQFYIDSVSQITTVLNQDLETTVASELEHTLIASDSSEASSFTRTGNDVLGNGDEVAEGGFLKILDLLVEFRIDSVDINHLGVLEEGEDDDVFDQGGVGPPRVPRAYALGSGYTGNVLRHTTRFAVGNVPKGTVVALKRYKPVPSRSDGHEDPKLVSTYESILQELKAYSEPTLRHHPNICELLYVGWKPDEQFPILVLELAAYGSLEDILRASGIGPSIHQKINLTIDIGLAIASLHACGIIHGDVKPGNILVQKHEERQLVAKVADFGGAFSILSSTTEPGMGTEMWWPPEIIVRQGSTSWEKADVYSYGLVVASIWGRSSRYSTESLSSSCFLHRFVPDNCTPEILHDRLVVMKFQDDESDDSVLRRCSVSQPINEIVSRTLSRDPALRKAMVHLVQRELQVLSESINRSIRLDIKNIAEAEYKALHLPSGNRRFSVWSDAFLSRKAPYQRLVFSRLLAEAQEVRSRLSFDPDTLLNSVEMTPEPLLAIIKHLQNTLLRNMTTLSAHFSRLAFFIAASYFQSIGTSSDRKEGIKWMKYSALTGHRMAVIFYPLLDTEGPSEVEADTLRELFLVLGAISGSATQSMEVLATLNPDLYRKTVFLLRTRISNGRLPSGQSEFNWEDLDEFEQLPLLNIDANLGLHCAIESFQIEHTQQILGNEQTDASILNDKGYGIMHSLTCISDAEASRLAPLCFARGASLDLDVGENDYSPELLGSTLGTPISWAAMVHMPMLFSTLLQLHIENKIPIQDIDGIFITACSLHDYEIISAIFMDYPEMLRSSSILQGFHCHFGLVRTFSNDDLLQLRRQVRHGANFRNAKICTIQILLDQGANPFQSCHSMGSVEPLCPLKMCIELKDAEVLQQFLSHDVDNWGLFDVIVSVVFDCITHNSIECFDILIQQPIFVVDSMEYAQKGLSLLRWAARHKNAVFATKLLEKGADPMFLDSVGFQPLAIALTDGHFETAEAIYAFMDLEEREQVFGPQPSSGFTLSGRILSRWISDRNPLLIECMKWLHSRGGSQWLGNVPDGQPTWNIILGRRQPPMAIHAAQDAIMLETLFEMFPDELERYDAMGWAPLHWATFSGHFGAVKYLLSRQEVKVNIELAQNSTGDKDGTTATTLAIRRMKGSGIPFDIQRGGRIEIQKWTMNMARIIELLIARGGRCGSGATQSERMEIMNHLNGSFNHTQVADMCEIQGLRDNSVWVGDWPEALPSDESSADSATVKTGEYKMKIRANDGRILRLKRKAALCYAGHEIQQISNATHFPETYASWLKETAKNCKNNYRKGKSPEVEVPVALQHYHRYRARIQRPTSLKGKEKCHNETDDLEVEPFPHFHRVHYIGPPLGNSRQDRDLRQFLKVVEATVLQQTSSGDYNHEIGFGHGANKTITLYTSTHQDVIFARVEAHSNKVMNMERMGQKSVEFFIIPGRTSETAVAVEPDSEDTDGDEEMWEQPRIVAETSNSAINVDNKRLGYWTTAQMSGFHDETGDEEFRRAVKLSLQDSITRNVSNDRQDGLESEDEDEEELLKRAFAMSIEAESNDADIEHRAYTLDSNYNDEDEDEMMKKAIAMSLNTEVQ